jgi:hypothetical protein
MRAEPCAGRAWLQMITQGLARDNRKFEAVYGPNLALWADDRQLGSYVPQGLKPRVLLRLFGTTEAVP